MASHTSDAIEEIDFFDNLNKYIRLVNELQVDKYLRVTCQPYWWWNSSTVVRIRFGDLLGVTEHRISSKSYFVNLTKLRNELPSFKSSSDIKLSPWLVPFKKKNCLCHHLLFRFLVFTAIMMKAKQAPAATVSIFRTKLSSVYTVKLPLTLINVYLLIFILYALR